MCAEKKDMEKVRSLKRSFSNFSIGSCPFAASDHPSGTDRPHGLRLLHRGSHSGTIFGRMLPFFAQEVSPAAAAAAAVMKAAVATKSHKSSSKIGRKEVF